MDITTNEKAGIEKIEEYFPNLTPEQKAQYAALGRLYPEWNEKINVISRKDIDNLYINHILHSLSIAAFMGELAQGTTILDLGTGGGFPGIPLAIYYPQCRFHLIDRIGKKIKVATEIAQSIRLTNVTFQHGDIGECKEKFNYVVSRAVMPLNDLVRLVRKNIAHTGKKSQTNKYSDGLICLKGGDIESECVGIGNSVISFPITEFINESRFDDKLIVYVPM